MRVHAFSVQSRAQGMLSRVAFRRTLPSRVLVLSSHLSSVRGSHFTQRPSSPRADECCRQNQDASARADGGLQSAITNAYTPAEQLECCSLPSLNPGTFNSLHFATLLTRLSKHGNLPEILDTIRNDPRFTKFLIHLDHHFKQHAFKTQTEYSPQEISNILTALQYLKIRGNFPRTILPIMDANAHLITVDGVIASDGTANAGSGAGSGANPAPWSPQNLAATLLAFAKLSLTPSLLTAHIATLLPHIIATGTPQAISNSTYAFALLSHHPPQLLDCFKNPRTGAATSRNFATHASPQELANFLWACGKLNVKAFSVPQLLDSLTASRFVTNADMPEVVMAVNGLSNLMYHAPTFMAHVGDMASDRFNSQTRHGNVGSHLAQLCAGMANVGYDEPLGKVLDAVAREEGAKSLADRCETSHLINIAHSITTSGCYERHQSLLRRLFTMIYQRDDVKSLTVLDGARLYAVRVAAFEEARIDVIGELLDNADPKEREGMMVRMTDLHGVMLAGARDQANREYRLHEEKEKRAKVRVGRAGSRKTTQALPVVKTVTTGDANIDVETNAVTMTFADGSIPRALERFVELPATKAYEHACKLVSSVPPPPLIFEFDEEDRRKINIVQDIGAGPNNRVAGCITVRNGPFSTATAELYLEVKFTGNLAAKRRRSRKNQMNFIIAAFQEIRGSLQSDKLVEAALLLEFDEEQCSFNDRAVFRADPEGMYSADLVVEDEKIAISLRNNHYAYSYIGAQAAEDDLVMANSGYRRQESGQTLLRRRMYKAAGYDYIAVPPAVASSDAERISKYIRRSMFEARRRNRNSNEGP